MFKIKAQKGTFYKNKTLKLAARHDVHSDFKFVQRQNIRLENKSLILKKAQFLLSAFKETRKKSFDPINVKNKTSWRLDQT